MTRIIGDDSKDAIADAQLLLDQREANERLLMATIRAQELAEEAERARLVASELQARAEEMSIALKQSESDLREEARFRELLIAVVAHDLGNPLAALKLFAALLEDTELSPTQTEAVARIGHSSNRLLGMVAQLLDFTRARHSPHMTLRLEPTNLGALCQRIAAELEIGSGHSIRCLLQGGLEGTWDAERLGQVLSNLCSNAIDHAAPGTDVMLEATIAEAEVLVEVRNQGEAIPTELLAIIFDPFRGAREQERSTRSNLGLGLYIARQIVVSHGGSLSARCAGGTTTFTVRLPRHPSV